MALPRRADRRSEHVTVGHRSEGPKGQIDPPDGSRYVRRIGARAGDAAQLSEVLGGGQRRRTSRPVDEDDAVLLGRVRHHEQVSSHARLVLLDDGRHVEDGRRGVERVPAGLQHLPSRDRLERMLGRDHAERAHHHRAPEGSLGWRLCLHRSTDDRGGKDEDGGAHEGLPVESP